MFLAAVCRHGEPGRVLRSAAAGRPAAGVASTGRAPLHAAAQVRHASGLACPRSSCTELRMMLQTGQDKGHITAVAPHFDTASEIRDSLKLLLLCCCRFLRQIPVSGTDLLPLQHVGHRPWASCALRRGRDVATSGQLPAHYCHPTPARTLTLLTLLVLCSLLASGPARDACSIVAELRQQADSFLRVYRPAADGGGSDAAGPSGAVTGVPSGAQQS